MPTYDYQCDACEHRFEQFQSMKDAALRKCPACGKLALRRLIGPGAAVIFKGSGFYQTDYRTEGYKKAAEADAPKTEEAKTTNPSTEQSKAPPAAPKQEPASSPSLSGGPKPTRSKGSSRRESRKS